jgi:hypothetical protein
MENVRDLKIHAIDEDQIATDHDVFVIRRRSEHYFEFPRAGLHFFWRPGGRVPRTTSYFPSQK